MVGKKRKGISSTAKLLLFITAMYFLFPLCVVSNCIVRAMCIGGLVVVAILMGFEFRKKAEEPATESLENKDRQ